VTIFAEASEYSLIFSLALVCSCYFEADKSCQESRCPTRMLLPNSVVSRINTQYLPICSPNTVCFFSPEKICDLCKASEQPLHKSQITDSCTDAKHKSVQSEICAHKWTTSMNECCQDNNDASRFPRAGKTARSNRKWLTNFPPKI
jgi:hypothetical protein